jgi:outer membrane protein assembly factor BamB
VIVFAGDGRIYGLAAATGKTLWVNQRTNPPLTVRNAAGGVVSRGGVFIGTAGGRLLGARLGDGRVGYDVAVATPRARPSSSASPTSRACRWWDERSVCAVAYQGRVACFDVVRGALLWTRDISSLAGAHG